ncbi:hypothetical protein B6U90_06230 [Thermoplasmatales archaeon ex4484_6]|nr:MAG: hypothetical protein B6U90_06230 [Thermoplasmatales archaeon ex4484_6]RLF65828.1 MAG: hypothetical protein DRN57_08295 [Thermoplasmata archaeon]
MIEVEDLRCAYNGSDVLKGVDLEVEEGTFMGLLGPNGCGKTTLLRCITGSLRPRRGSVRIMGREISGWGRKELSRKLSIVPQDTSPGFDFSVEEVVAMGRYPHMGRFQLTDPDGGASVNRALRWTGLSELRSKKISMLSGGERQRAFIARAFAQDADILLMDEPTKNLDIRHSMDIMSLVRKKNGKEGLTILAVLHDLDLSVRFCDKVALMKDGKVYDIGPVRKVINEDSVGDVFDIDVKVHRGKHMHIEVLG